MHSELFTSKRSQGNEVEINWTINDYVLPIYNRCEN